MELLRFSAIDRPVKYILIMLGDQCIRWEATPGMELVANTLSVVADYAELPKVAHAPRVFIEEQPGILRQIILED